MSRLKLFSSYGRAFTFLLFSTTVVLSFVNVQASPSFPLCSVLSGVSPGEPVSFSISSGVSSQNLDASLILSVFSGTGEEAHYPILMTISYEDPPGIIWKEKSTDVLILPFVLSNLSIKVELQPSNGVGGVSGISNATNSTLHPFQFSFLSYVANHPSCFIPLTPEIPFRGSILNFVTSPQAKKVEHAFAYFSVTLPLEYNSVVLRVSGDPTPTASIFVIKNSTDADESEERSIMSFDVAEQSPEVKPWYMYKSGDAIPGKGKIYFAYTPDLPLNANNERELCELEISVEYMYTTNTAAPITSSSPLPSNPEPQKSSSKFRFGLLKVLFVLLILWYLIAAYRNYAVLGEHQFPFMFPFTERISLFLSSFGFFGVRRPEYHNLDERI